MSERDERSGPFLESPTERGCEQGGEMPPLAPDREDCFASESDLLEMLPIGICRTTPTGKVLDANFTMARIYGFRDGGSLLAADPRSLYTDEANRAWWQSGRGPGDALRTRELRQLRRDGAAIWIRETVQRVRDGRGRVLSCVALLEDITRQKNAEEALAESERSHRRFVESLGVRHFFYRHDRQGRFTYVSPSIALVLGYDPEDYRAHYAEMFTDDPVNAEAVRRTERTLRGELQPPYEIEVRAKDGSIHRLEVTEHPVPGPRGDVEHVEGIAHDITERKQTEDRLAESEQRLRTILETEPECVKLVASDGTVLAMNPAGLDMLEASGTQEVIGRSVYDLVCPEHHAAFRALNEAVFRGEVRTAEFEIVGCKGTRLWMETHAAPLRDAEGRIFAQLAVTRDVTERKRAGEALRSSHEQLRRLSERLHAARESERASLAREIHDELGGSLTALRMDLAHQLSLLPKGQTAFSRRMRRQLKLADEIIKTVKRLSAELRPPVLDDFGLMAALQWQAGLFQARSGVRCRLRANIEKIDLDNERSTAVFRICQECLTNVARHASATRVEILLTEEGEELRLEIRDNGRGISKRELEDRGSLGLLGMRERALLLGGSVSFEPGRPRGTTVRLCIPLPGRRENQRSGA